MPSANKKRLFIITALTLLLGLSVPISAQEQPALNEFFGAVKLYEAGNYQQAADIFSQLAGNGQANAATWYNLGNCYYRLGQNGSALWAFKEAQKLAPRWEDLQANMALISQKGVDELPPLHPAWQHTIFFWHYIFSAREHLYLLLIFNLLFWGLLILSKKRAHELTSMGLVISLILLLAMAGSVIKDLAFTTPEGVVKNTMAQVHSANNPSAQVLFEIHEGTEFFVEEEQSDWLLITLSDGKRGWMAKSDAAGISL